MTAAEWKKVKKGLEQEIKIDIPGTGIAFVTPLSSIGGKRQLRFLTEDRGFEKEEESSLKGTDYELLVVIANQGYTDVIMDAARKANATGGTVIHAKGTGMEKAEKFLGVSLAQEKEMIFMVTKTKDKKRHHAEHHEGSRDRKQGGGDRLLSAGDGNSGDASDREE